MKATVPGIILCASIAALSKMLETTIPGWSATGIALVTGIVIGNLITVPQSCGAGVKWVEKTLLPIAILFLGACMQPQSFAQLNAVSFISITLSVSLSLLVSFVLYRLFWTSIPSRIAFLITIGNTICGSAAIVASGPLLKSRREEIGLSIAVINLLGTLGLFALPVISHWAGLSSNTAGIWMGSTLQALGQVAAASFSLGPEAGEIAVLVKMARISLLIPLLLIVSLTQEGQPDRSWWKQVPWYLYGFLIFAVLGHILDHPYINQGAQMISKTTLIVAMVAIGLGVNLQAIKKNAGQVLAFIGVTFIAQAALVLAYLY